jgi:hypothetical protein
MIKDKYSKKAEEMEGGGRPIIIKAGMCIKK